MNVCRVCLCSTPQKDITQLGLVENEEKYSYEEIMLFCLNIQIDQDSKVSMKLCTKCFSKITEFHLFKCEALRNDAYLRSIETQDTKSDEIINNGVKEESFQITEIHLKSDEISENIVKEGSLQSSDVHLLDDLHFSDNEIYNEIPILVVKEEDIKNDQSAIEIDQNITYEYIEIPKVNAPATKKRKESRTKTTKIRKKMKIQNAENNVEVCSECGKQVKNLKNHLVTHYPQEKRKTYECEICEKIFQTSQGRKVHVKRKHTANARKECNLCGVAVLHLNRHMKTVHEPEARRFQCVSCDKKFVSRSVLNAHVALHTDHRPFKCDSCEQVFRTNQMMKFHKRRVHQKEKGFECDICSKKFFLKESLVTHLRLHTQEKPYKCPDCDKAFTSSGTLKKHRLIHSKKKLECTQCDRRFSVPNYLRAHMLTHTKEKRHPCRYCNVAFRRSDHRNRHEMTAHLKSGKIIAATS